MTKNFLQQCIIWVVICLCIFAGKVPSAQESAAATTSGIALDELEGTTLEGVIHYANRVRRDGRTFSGTADWRYRIDIRKKGELHVVVTWQAVFPGKKPRPQRYNNVETVGVPNTKRDQDGARSVLWLFENDTLTLLRVYDAGGRRIDFKLARAEQGFRCGVKSAFMTENAKLAPRIAGWEVLERRELRSSCNASKANR
jgi:hypothetical protein